MFRLIKLALYALIGYAIYEIYQGMTAEPAHRRPLPIPPGGPRNAPPARSSEPKRRGENLTGAGRGQTEQTIESSGGSESHRVGRGVTR